MIFYTADLHFGSQALVQTRSFSSVEEMDQALIQNWNALVSPQDTVYLLGDIGHHDDPMPLAQLSRLQGHKHLIRGNHDTGYPEQEQLFSVFESITDLLEIEDGPHHITLCHYPMVYNQGGYMIHGHIHDKKNELYALLTQLPRVLNAGVDVNGFAPVSLSALIENNQKHYDNPEKGCPPGSSHSKKRKWKAVFQPLPVKSQGGSL